VHLVGFYYKKRVVIPYRRFGTIYRSHFQGSRIFGWMSENLFCGIDQISIEYVDHRIKWDEVTLETKRLTLILLTWRIRWAPNNASRWQMVFNSVFKGLISFQSLSFCAIMFLLYNLLPSLYLCWFAVWLCSLYCWRLHRVNNCRAFSCR
jgi:hypothetical protein